MGIFLEAYIKQGQQKCLRSRKEAEDRSWILRHLTPL